MKHYAILRCERIQTWSDLVQASRHNVRDQRVSSTVEGRPAPIELIERGPISLPAHAKRTYAALGIVPDPAKVTAVEYVISASPDWFTGKDEKTLRDWVESVLKFLRKKHGPGLIAATMHLDESTPHIHAICLPVYQDIVRKRGAKPKTPEAVAKRALEELAAPKIWRQSYDRVMGSGRLALRDLQTEYHKAVGHLGLARGEDTVGQGKRHTPLREFRKQLDERQRLLDEQEFEQAQRKEQLQRAEAELDFRIQQFASEVVELEREHQLARDEQARLAQAAADAAQRQKDLDARQLELVANEQKVRGRNDELAKRERDLAAMQAAHTAAVANQEVQLRLLARHAEKGEPITANSIAVAKIDKELQAATAPWSQALLMIKELILKTRRTRQRMATQLLRIRSRLHSVRKREAAVMLEAASLEQRSEHVRQREAGASGRIEAAARREASVRRQAAENELARSEIEKNTNLLKIRAGVLDRKERAQDQFAGDLDEEAGRIARLRDAIAADNRQIATDRAEYDNAVRKLANQRADLGKQVIDHQRAVRALEERKQHIELEAVRVASRDRQMKAEKELLDAVVAGRIAADIAGGRVLIRSEKGWIEPIVDGRRPSEAIKATLRLVVSAQRMRTDAMATGRQLQAVAAELEAMRPERKAQIDVQKAAIAAALAQRDRGGGAF